MEIRGRRVKCANCEMIYDRLPDERVFWIGVPFSVVGSEVCPKCGSNAADPALQNKNVETTDHTNPEK